MYNYSCPRQLFDVAGRTWPALCPGMCVRGRWPSSSAKCVTAIPRAFQWSTTEAWTQASSLLHTAREASSHNRAVTPRQWQIRVLSLYRYHGTWQVKDVGKERANFLGSDKKTSPYTQDAVAMLTDAPLVPYTYTNCRRKDFQIRFILSRSDNLSFEINLL